jgi:hypothetical protein
VRAAAPGGGGEGLYISWKQQNTLLLGFGVSNITLLPVVHKLPLRGVARIATSGILITPQLGDLGWRVQS